MATNVDEPPEPRHGEIGRLFVSNLKLLAVKSIQELKICTNPDPNESEFILIEIRDDIGLEETFICKFCLPLSKMFLIVNEQEVIS